jgi:hypothetical protein
VLRAVLLAGALAVSGCAPAAATPSAARVSPVAHPPHILLIVEENRDYGAVIGNPDAPYINGLATSAGLARQMFAQAHPSLPDYLELLSGSTGGIRDDGTDHVLAGPTFVDQLAGAGIGWRAYVEDLPAPCFNGAASGGYAKKHNPFMYFSSITGSPAQCRRVVPAAQLDADLAGGALPPFVWLEPDLCHDGHDCATPQMDAWLSQTLPRFLASSWFRDGGEAIIVWDEGTGSEGCCRGAAGGHVPAIVVRNHPGARTSDRPVDDAGVLATLERSYGLPLLGDAACPCSGDLLSLTG